MPGCSRSSGPTRKPSGCRTRPPWIPAAPGAPARDPYLLETSVPGIFAAGDVRFSPVKRVAAAVGEESMASAFVHQYLRDNPGRAAAPRI